MIVVIDVGDEETIDGLQVLPRVLRVRRIAIQAAIVMVIVVIIILIE